jgi:hypothetical protein
MHAAKKWNTQITQQVKRARQINLIYFSTQLKHTNNTT